MTTSRILLEINSAIIVLALVSIVTNHIRIAIIKHKMKRMSSHK